MVLADDLVYLPAEPVFLRKLDPLFYVGKDDEAAHARGQVLVGVLEVPFCSR